MDLFKRKRGEWIKKVQGTVTGETGRGHVFEAVPEKDANRRGKGEVRVEEARKKTGIELAREKYAQKKGKRGTGVNRIAV